MSTIDFVTPAPVEVARTSTSDVAGVSSGGWSARTWVPVALGGASVVTLAVAGAFRLSADQAESDANAMHAAIAGNANDDPSARARLAEVADSQRTRARTSNILLVTGGTLAVGAVATWLFWPTSKSATAIWITPSLQPRDAAIEVGGTF